MVVELLWKSVQSRVATTLGPELNFRGNLMLDESQVHKIVQHIHILLSLAA